MNAKGTIVMTCVLAVLAAPAAAVAGTQAASSSSSAAYEAFSTPQANVECVYGSAEKLVICQGTNGMTIGLKSTGVPVKKQLTAKLDRGTTLTGVKRWPTGIACAPMSHKGVAGVGCMNASKHGFVMYSGSLYALT
jgi:hypothetical protein